MHWPRHRPDGVALPAIDDDGCRRLDREVLQHWQDDSTRASLERMRKPKGLSSRRLSARSGRTPAGRAANSSGCSMAAKWPPRGMTAQWVTLYCCSTHERGQRSTSFGYRATPVGTPMKGSFSLSTPLWLVSQ